MLKMIIADDEIIVREGLLDIINWNEYGVEIIGEATDGQEAFDLCMKLKADILLTDIRMPFMDGLEAAMKMKESGANIKIIFFSGIQDFNYAKTAVNVNAEGYILKPLEVNELKEVISKVVNKVLAERERETRFSQLKLQMQENFGTLREKFLRNLVLGVYKNEQDIVEKLNYFKIAFRNDESICVAVIQIDEYYGLTRDYSEGDKQLLNFAVTNISDEILENYTTGNSFCINENEFVLIFKYDNLMENKLDLMLNDLMTCLKGFVKASLSVGVGKKVTAVYEAAISYKAAATALQYKFYTGKGSIMHINDMHPTDANNLFADLLEKENRLMSLIKLGDENATEELLNDIFTHLCSDKAYTIEYVQGVCAEFVYITSRSIYELGENLDNILKSRVEILEDIYSKEDIFDLKAYMCGILTSVAEHFSKKYTQKNGKVISDIKSIIEKSYMKDISINRISEQVFLSPNHISMIFRQETGETITDYITKIRMEKAKELLGNLDNKILEVAEAVGYEDASYFSKVFKKYTGIYPQKFRQLKQG